MYSNSSVFGIEWQLPSPSAIGESHIIHKWPKHKYNRLTLFGTLIP